MQILKEEAAGRLYLMRMYSAGVLPRHTPQQRAARRAKTTEGKRKLNAMHRKFTLMLLLAANFRAGRDLFVCLEYDKPPGHAASAKALKNFHRRMRTLCEGYGTEYKYILVTETHKRDGAPVRLHHHIILTGTGRLMRGKILEAWGQGPVDVRVLRELTDNFEDTCRYLLKERKPEGCRAYSASHNLTRPPEPLRRKRPEGAAGVTPPGVKVVRHVLDSNDFGRYEMMIGKIIDARAFAAYWDKAQRDTRRLEEDRHWKRYAREKNRRKQAGFSPEMGSNFSPEQTGRNETYGEPYNKENKTT